MCEYECNIYHYLSQMSKTYYVSKPFYLPLHIYQFHYIQSWTLAFSLWPTETELSSHLIFSSSHRRTSLAPFCHFTPLPNELATQSLHEQQTNQTYNKICISEPYIKYLHYITHSLTLRASSRKAEKLVRFNFV